MTFCALGKMEEAPVKMEEAPVIIEIMSLGRGGLHRGIYNGNGGGGVFPSVARGQRHGMWPVGAAFPHCSRPPPSSSGSICRIRPDRHSGSGRGELSGTLSLGEGRRRRVWRCVGCTILTPSPLFIFVLR